MLSGLLGLRDGEGEMVFRRTNLGQTFRYRVQQEKRSYGGRSAIASRGPWLH